MAEKKSEIEKMLAGEWYNNEENRAGGALLL